VHTVAECATDPPVLEAQYAVYIGGADDPVAALSDGSMSEGMVHDLFAGATRVDPCIETVSMASDRSDWALVENIWMTRCDEDGCRAHATLAYPQAGDGQIWLHGIIEGQVVVSAVPAQVRVSDKSPDLDWIGFFGSDCASSCPEPPAPVFLETGEQWGGTLVADFDADRVVSVDIVGDAPPGFRTDPLTYDPIEVGVEFETTWEDAGAWTFQAVATDEEGSTGAVTFEFEVRRVCGCHQGAGPLGWLYVAVPIAGLWRRRARA
jgi:hypothetical protein